MAEVTTPAPVAPAAPAAAPVAAAVDPAPAVDPAQEAPVAAVGEAAEPAKPVQPEPAKDPLAPKLGKIAQREARIRQEREQLAQERKQWESQQEAAKSEKAELARLQALRSNPLAFVRELGLTPQQFLELAAKNDAPDPALVGAVEQTRQKTEQLEKKLADQEAQAAKYQQAQQVAAYHGRIEALIAKDSDRWGYAVDAGITPQYVLDAAIQHVKSNNLSVTSAQQEEAIFQQVLDKAQAWQKAILTKSKARPTWEKDFQPPAAAPAPAKPQPPANKKTLTNQAQSTTPVETRRLNSISRDDDVAEVMSKYSNLFPEKRAPKTTAGISSEIGELLAKHGKAK